MKFRDEKDSMGTVRVPAAAYYGSQTQRAVENFPISGMRLPPEFIHGLALVKKCAVRVNDTLGLLDPKIAPAIAHAAQDVMDGRLDDQFVVDVFQTGSGTSTNMNMNEVVASRANEILTGTKGGRSPVHPNDHVNMGQSSNDVIPSVIHIAALTRIHRRLIPSLETLHRALAAKSDEFKDIQKLGRTHLQDAVPMTLGQEFSGYARQIELGMDRLRAAEPRLAELALGGTAVGNGLNAHPEFAGRVIELIAEQTGLPFCEAVNHFEAQAAQDAAIETSGALKTLAVGMIKIANDIRWLASGPRSGIGEITIPSLQPGSSIMPGKVNPVIPEAVIQVATQVIGNDTTITMGGQAGNFELNVMLPVIAYNLLQSIATLASVAEAFNTKCIAGIRADREACAAYIERSLALVTGLVPKIGYDQAAIVAKKAYETGKTIRQVALEGALLPEKELDDLLKIPS
ncbi:aspartate ammonia-lyase [Alkalispirochaeta odontotermitis]|nr:aspartate ammonia-lyase [Alkalispirochaeta odontotermitis]CAB1071876.1 Fumarate hydratase class II (EC [Olavius algarvensis Delta 1 endosymbiont]